MLRRMSINLGNLLLSMSDALDLASSSVAAHQQRTAYVCLELGKAMRLAADRMENLFVGALLHDIGALTPEEKVALHDSEVEDTEVHCKRGEALLADVPWLCQAAPVVRSHHTPWAARHEQIDAPGVLESQMLHLSDVLERAIRRDVYILHQQERLTAAVKNLSGSEVHQDVVNSFMAIAGREEFWLDLVSPRLYSLLLHDGPYREIAIGLDDLSNIARLFRNIIDFRSRFTATHSSGVAECAATLARFLGLAEPEVRMMEVAGNLHDLGKLAVPNAILEKAAGLNREEYAVIRQHTYWTFAVLNTIGGLDLIAEWAAFHHERLDGAGYPFHLRGEQLGSGARIMAVADIFTALAEDRPYRKGMNQGRAAPILAQQAERGLLDPTVVRLVLDNYGEVESRVRDSQAATRALYESRFG